MKKVWDWNKFYNGLADNPYMGTDGQFQDGSVAIDVQTDPKGVKLYSAAKTLYATSGAANCFYDIGQIGASGTLSGHQDGKVYREDGTLVYTLTGAVSPNAILAITGRIDSGTPKIYVFTANKVHRFNTDFTGAQENFLSNDTGTNRHVVTIAGDIYFTSANKIYLINSAAGIETRFTGNAAETINGLTVFQDTLRAYSAYGSSYGELKIINPADGSLLSTVPFDRLPIL